MTLIPRGLEVSCPSADSQVSTLRCLALPASVRPETIGENNQQECKERDARTSDVSEQEEQ